MSGSMRAHLFELPIKRRVVPDLLEVDCGSGSNSTNDWPRRPWPGQRLADLLPRLDEPGEAWCQLQLEFWLYALRHRPVRGRVAALYCQDRVHLAPPAMRYTSARLEPAEVAAATIALYRGLTLQRHGDPGAVRPGLVSRILRALDRRGARGHGGDNRVAARAGGPGARSRRAGIRDDASARGEA